MRHLSLLPPLPYLPTASELHRAAECVAPWALGLPEAEDAPGEWAEFGRRMHKIAEFAAEGAVYSVQFMGGNDNGTPQEQAMFEHLKTITDADRAQAKRADGNRAMEAFWTVEQGVKWRTDGFDDTAALCERQPGERLRGWFSGTVDLAYVREDSVVVIVDWKFGPREKVNGEPAKDSCQGFFLALAFCALLEVTGSSDGVAVARFERRMVSDRGIEVDAHDITWGELCRWRDTLTGLAERITKATNAMPRISAACGKCKAKAECPAWEMQNHAVYHHVAGNLSVALSRPPTSPDDVRALHCVIDAAEHYTTEWKKWRDAYVLANGAVSLGMGMALKALPQTKRAVVATPEAIDAIEAVAGKAAIVVERSATCDSIKKAVRDAAGDGITSTADRNKAKAKAEAEAFAALIASGAVRESGKTYVVRKVRANETEE